MVGWKTAQPAEWGDGGDGLGHRSRALRSAAAGRGGKALGAFPRALPGSLARRVRGKVAYPAGGCPQGRPKNGVPCGCLPAGEGGKRSTQRVFARRVGRKTGYPAGGGPQGKGKSGVPCGRGLQGMGKGLEGLEGVAEAVEFEGLADLEHDLDTADEDIICLNALGLEALAADEGEGKLGAAAEHGTDCLGL